jgi:hypothetical protein
MGEWDGECVSASGVETREDPSNVLRPSVSRKEHQYVSSLINLRQSRLPGRTRPYVLVRL